MINNQNLAVLSEKVAYLENALKTAGVLPSVSASDNGAALQVVDGAWATGDPIPDAVTANPTGEITQLLSGLQIGNSKYNIASVSALTMGAYIGSITRIGNARIIDLQCTDNQAATNTTLSNTGDFPNGTRSAQAWVQTSEAGAWATLNLTLTSEGLLSTDKAVYRGHVTMFYVI